MEKCLESTWMSGFWFLVLDIEELLLQHGLCEEQSETGSRTFSQTGSGQLYMGWGFPGVSLHQPFLLRFVLREVFFLFAPSVCSSGHPDSPDLGREWGCY